MRREINLTGTKDISKELEKDTTHVQALIDMMRDSTQEILQVTDSNPDVKLYVFNIYLLISRYGLKYVDFLLIEYNFVP